MDYNSLQGTVRGLIQEFGVPLVLLKKTRGAFNPSTGEYESTTTSNYTVNGIIRFPNRVGFGDKYLDGTAIQSGDREIIIAVSEDEVVPEPLDLMGIAGVNYTIVTALALQPGGVDLLYRCLCRK